MNQPRGGAARLPAFQELLEQHAEAVLSFLVHRVGAGDADDCFQETWLAALRAYPSLRDGGNLRGWLLTIARNKATDSQRAQSRRALPVADIHDSNGQVVGEADAELWEEVRALPPKQRTAVVLRFVDDREYADIAQSMRTNEAAARRNVHEGVKKLRRSRT